MTSATARRMGHVAFWLGFAGIVLGVGGCTASVGSGMTMVIADTLNETTITDISRIVLLVSGITGVAGFAFGLFGVVVGAACKAFGFDE